MSRSYKKTPGWKGTSSFGKRQANKRVRRTKDVPNGRSFKKLYCSYDICDWADLYFSKQEILREAGDCVHRWTLQGFPLRRGIPIYRFYRK